MGIKEMTLLFIFLFDFCSPASLNPVTKNMVSIHLQKSMRNEGMDEHSSFTNGGKIGGGIVHHRKFAHGSGGHGEGGRAAGAGQNENGSQSNSPNTQGSGTAAVIPVYAAGAAAGRHNNHRNAATCSHCCIGLPTLIAVVFAYMVIHSCVLLEF